MKIDLLNTRLIGCLPVSLQSYAPTDQSPCIIEKCSLCNEDMWVSERKRKLRDTQDNVKIYCVVCIINEANRQGLEAEVIQLNEMN
jgi:hypothetical protein